MADILIEDINRPINRIEAFDAFRVEFNSKRIVIEGRLGRDQAGEFLPVENVVLVVNPGEFASAINYLFPSTPFSDLGVSDPDETIRSEVRRRVRTLLLWRVEQIKSLPHGTLQTDIMADF